MDKSQAEKIATFIDFLNERHEVNPFEYKINEYWPRAYELVIDLTTTAYRNEANALALVIDECTYLHVRQKARNNDEIYWKIW